MFAEYFLDMLLPLLLASIDGLVRQDGFSVRAGELPAQAINDLLCRAEPVRPSAPPAEKMRDERLLHPQRGRIQDSLSGKLFPVPAEVQLDCRAGRLRLADVEYDLHGVTYRSSRSRAPFLPMRWIGVRFNRVCPSGRPASGKVVPFG